MTDHTEAPKCIHMTADMAKNCPTCNPPPFSWPEGVSVCAPREVYDTIQERVFPTDQTDAPERTYTRDELQAAVAAALEEAAADAQHASEVYERRAQELGGNEDRRDDCIRAMASDLTAAGIAIIIRALITPEQSAALDRVKAEARREERERCAKIAEEHGRAIYRANKNTHPEIAAEALADGDAIAAAIRAEAENP